MIADRELDALLRGVLADEAARVERDSPALEQSVALLLPRVQDRSRGTGRLVLVAATLLLLLGGLVSAIAVGAWLRTTNDDRPAPNAVHEFRAVGPLPAGEMPQAMIAQPDGSALIIGSDPTYTTTKILRFDPQTLHFTQVGTLHFTREFPQAVAIQAGRVLIVGGEQLGDASAATGGYPAEIYDASAGMTVSTGHAHYCAWACTATLLPDGSVLVVGGGGMAELFDPATGAFVATGPMSRPRQNQAAVLLDDGRVLVIGGDGTEAPTADADLYDPKTRTFTPAGPMAVSQVSGFTATRLADGRVLIVGGWDEAGNVVADAQIYDPDTDRFARTGSLPGPRLHHSAALLNDGRVLIVGGWDSGEDAVTQGDDAFIYDPSTGAFTPTASLGVQRIAPLVVTLADGRVLVAGSRCWNNGCYGLDDLPSAADREFSSEVFK